MHWERVGRRPGSPITYKELNTSDPESDPDDESEMEGGSEPENREPEHMQQIEVLPLVIPGAGGR